jgi:hypothetical protein
MVANGNGGYVSTYGIDNARAFVAQNNRHGGWKQLIPYHHIGVTDTRGHYAHAHLIGPRWVQQGFFHLQWRGRLTRDGCFDRHRLSVGAGHDFSQSTGQ